MRTRLLLRSLVLAIALVAGALVAGMPADAGPAPVRLPPNSRASFLDSLNTFGMPSHYEGGVASIEAGNQPIHGASATTTVEKPYVSAVDASGFSVSVTDANDPGNLVRIGWEVNPTDDEYKNEPLEPHLFAEHWVGGENRGDEPFVAQPASHKLGDLLPPGVAHSFKVIRLGGVWWVNLDGEYLGYFPDAEWGGLFTNARIATWTGMVGTQSDSTCADMGFSGLPGTDPAAALVTLTSVYRVDDFGIYVSPPRQMAGWFQRRQDLYTAGNIDPTSQTFRYAATDTADPYRFFTEPGQRRVLARTLLERTRRTLSQDIPDLCPGQRQAPGRWNMRARLLLRSLALAGAFVAGLLVAGAPAGAEQAPAKLPPGTPKTFIKTLNMFDMLHRYQAGVATVEDSKNPIHGARAYTTIEQPSVGLMEASGFAISVTDSVDPGNVVRVGWEVNPTDPDYSEAPFAPHLFAEHWVDGVNRGDEPFLAISGVPQLGDVLTPSDNLYEFKIARVGGNWWVAFNGYYLGDFPDSEWGGQFTSAIIASWNGAVGSKVLPECADMGRNGLPGTDPAAAFVTLVSVLRVDDEIHISPPRIMGEIPGTDPVRYSAGNIDPASQSFRYGGDGDC